MLETIFSISFRLNSEITRSLATVPWKERRGEMGTTLKAQIHSYFQTANCLCVLYVKSIS